MKKSHGIDDGPFEHWQHVPKTLQYLRLWANRFGVRGLTVYFGRQPPLSKLVLKKELPELQAAYETVALRDDAARISQWCLSIQPSDPANQAKEKIRGLLLLFERLADRGLSPFTDMRVRFVPPDAPSYDWNVLPADLHQWKCWLKKFEELRTEHELFQYAQNANDAQLRELEAVRDLLGCEGERLRAWCMANNVEGNPANSEAFQAEWLFLLVEFAQLRIDTLRAREVGPASVRKRSRR